MGKTSKEVAASHGVWTAYHDPGNKKAVRKCVGKFEGQEGYDYAQKVAAYIHHVNGSQPRPSFDPKKVETTLTFTDGKSIGQFLHFAAEHPEIELHYRKKPQGRAKVHIQYADWDLRLNDDDSVKACYGKFDGVTNGMTPEDAEKHALGAAKHLQKSGVLPTISKTGAVILPKQLVQEVRKGVFAIEVPSATIHTLLGKLKAREIGWSRHYVSPNPPALRDIIRDDWRERHAPALQPGKARALLAQYSWESVEGGTHAPAGLAAEVSDPAHACQIAEYLKSGHYLEEGPANRLIREASDVLVGNSEPMSFRFVIPEEAVRRFEDEVLSKDHGKGDYWDRPATPGGSGKPR